MIFFTIVAPIDDARARVSKETLTEQATMELLVRSMETHWAFSSCEGEYLDISEWMGLRLDDSGCVTHIVWPYDDDCDDEDDESDDTPCITQGGSIDFTWLPEKLGGLILTSLYLNGSVDTEVLPSTLEEFTIDNNEITGTFSITGLPRGMKYVSICRNRFEGSLLLSKLPPAMVTFRAEGNQLSGALDFTSLPSPLEYIELSANQFCGAIDLRSLPAGLQVIRLQKNSLTQDVIYIDHTAKSLYAVSFDAEKIPKVEMTDGKIPKTYTPSRTCNVSFS